MSNMKWETNLSAIIGKLLWREPRPYLLQKPRSTVPVFPGDKAVTLAEAHTSITKSGGTLELSVSLSQGTRIGAYHRWTPVGV